MTATVATEWNVELLEHAVDFITGEQTAAVSWADENGEVVSRGGRKKRPPQLVVGVCVRDDGTEARIRALPRFMRLRSWEREDLDGEPVRVLRAVFAREHGG